MSSSVTGVEVNIDTSCLVLMKFLVTLSFHELQLPNFMSP